MAKQSGIHQIKGKVGEMSYYRQKGVSSGLIRGINQGMSERVKTEEGYANTRLNNAEFGNACKIASAAYNSVNTRKRGMMRNFAISAMAKVALEDIKQGTGAWGARVPATELDTLICDLLERHAKGGSYDGKFGVIENVSLELEGGFEFDLNLEVEGVQALLDLGIDGFYVVPSKCLAGEIIVDDVPRLYAGNAVGAPTQVSLNAGESINPTFSGSVGTPSSVGISPSGYTFATEDTKHGFYLCVTFLPYRQQGASRYVLQEHCTYVAIPLGQIPEE